MLFLAYIYLVKVIADASILIHLSSIGRFHILKKLYGEIVIPDGVYSEVVIEGWGLPGSLETSEGVKEGSIKVCKIINIEKIKEWSVRYKVSTTNAEVIQLTYELNTNLVLADEEEVRSATEDANFKIKGCLGILIDAVKSNLISCQQAEEDIDNLISSGYRVGDEIVNKLKETLRRLKE